MNLVCLDMEGVVAPEIWIEFADAAGIPELRKTTRDEPDYDKLMKYRINILREHDLKLAQIQEVAAKLDPLPGARAFLDELRTFCQVIILSDTFEETASGLFAKLGYPTVFCNNLIVDDQGYVVDYNMRIKEGNTKTPTVQAFMGVGMKVFASGDSFNDLGMIQAADAGCLFRTTDAIKADLPHIVAVDTYDELMAQIKDAFGVK